MLEVSKEVLLDSIIALESKLFEVERNNRIHKVAGINGDNLKVMLEVLRHELLSRNTNKL